MSETNYLDTLSDRQKRNKIRIFNICFVLICVLIVAGKLMSGYALFLATNGETSYSKIDRIIVFNSTGIFLVIGCMVLACMLLYQSWKLIPKEIARTTPGLAVGLLFIPIFNLYWIFVACAGLAEDMNKALEQRGLSSRVNKILGIAICILAILSCIPMIIHSFSFFALVNAAFIIVCIVFFYSVIRDAIALLKG